MCLSSDVPPPPPPPEPLKELDEKTRRANQDAKRKAALASGLESTWTRGSMGSPTASSPQSTKAADMGGAKA